MPKKEKPKCKSCGTAVEIIFEGDGVQYPVYACPSCGNKNNEWEKWWKEYSLRWKEKDKWENPKDKPSCFLGYFCHKFFEFYKFPYTFDISSPIPYMGKEFTMARRIIAMFDGDAREASLYIKWVFTKKVRNRKKPITSLGFFTMADFINEFKYAKAQSQILKRHTPLPEEYLLWCKSDCPEIFEKHDFKTWNDLNSLVSFIKAYKVDGIEKKAVMEAVSRNMLPVSGNEPDFRKLED